MTNQEKFMKEALKEAKKAYDKEEIPVGAVIVKDGKIIGRRTQFEGNQEDIYQSCRNFSN